MQQQNVAGVHFFFFFLVSKLDWRLLTGKSWPWTFFFFIKFLVRNGNVWEIVTGCCCDSMLGCAVCLWIETLWSFRSLLSRDPGKIARAFLFTLESSVFFSFLVQDFLPLVRTHIVLYFRNGPRSTISEGCAFVGSLELGVEGWVERTIRPVPLRSRINASSRRWLKRRRCCCITGTR